MNDPLIEQFAKQYNLDVNVLQSLISFLVRNISKNELLYKLFLKNPELVITEGVSQWKRKGDEFYKELLAGESVRSKQWIEQICNELNKGK